MKLLQKVFMLCATIALTLNISQTSQAMTIAPEIFKAQCSTKFENTFRYPDTKQQPKLLPGILTPRLLRILNCSLKDQNTLLGYYQTKINELQQATASETYYQGLFDAFSTQLQLFINDYQDTLKKLLNNQALIESTTQIGQAFQIFFQELTKIIQQPEAITELVQSCNEFLYPQTEEDFLNLDEDSEDEEDTTEQQHQDSTEQPKRTRRNRRQDGVLVINGKQKIAVGPTGQVSVALLPGSKSNVFRKEGAYVQLTELDPITQQTEKKPHWLCKAAKYAKALKPDKYTIIRLGITGWGLIGVWALIHFGNTPGSYPPGYLPPC